MIRSNRIDYPDCWAFFEEHARNMQGELEEKIGKYRVSKPDKSGLFIYANCPKELWWKLHAEWYKISIESPSLYGTMQYITQNLNH